MLAAEVHRHHLQTHPYRRAAGVFIALTGLAWAVAFPAARAQSLPGLDKINEELLKMSPDKERPIFGLPGSLTAAKNGPLTAPVPLALFRNPDAKVLMDACLAAIKTEGFENPIMVPNRTIEAQRKVEEGQVREQALLWFARDMDDPTTVVVFMLTARYQNLFGFSSPMRTDLLPDDELKLRSHLQSQLNKSLLP